MAESSEWSFPEQLRPQPEELSFNLQSALDSVVLLRADIPGDAFTAPILGTERAGYGVVIGDDGLVLTIGYLITEADSLWLTANDGTIVRGHAVAYDFATGFGLAQPLGRLGTPWLARGKAAALSVGDPVTIVGHGGRAHALKAQLIAKRVCRRRPGRCAAGSGWRTRFRRRRDVADNVAARQRGRGSAADARPQRRCGEGQSPLGGSRRLPSQARTAVGRAPTSLLPVTPPASSKGIA